ncbi:MAG TPA: MFS transporter, partial [Candidatus Saccharimonadales bacterium]|nr:MFS transporter [Candidatus Saccharimonadales bacterium]
METHETILVSNPPHKEHIALFSIPWFKKWGSLIVLSLALAIIIIDTTILNVSLRTIINDLHTDIQSIQWVITAYTLMLAAFTITGGRIGDLFGRKKMFVVGAVIFAVGSFITSISTSVGMMIGGESIIEGIGAALMLPATASLLVANFKGKDRAIAFGVWGSVAGASGPIGSILGGWLTVAYSWRWAFRINVFIAVILVIGSIIIKESHERSEKPSLDLVGVFLSAMGMLSIVYGLIESSEFGWWASKKDFVFFDKVISPFGLSPILFFIAYGLLIIGYFFLWENYREKSGKTPLVSLKLFANHAFALGTLITAIISMGLLGFSFMFPVFWQAVLKLDPLQTGVAMVPMSITMFIVSPLSALLGHKLGMRILIQVGLLLTMIAIALMAFTLGPNITPWNMVPALVIFGVGLGAVMAQISNLTLSAVSVQQAGEASGVNNTLRQVGATLGVAIIGSVLLLNITNNLQTGVQNS